MVLSLDGSSNNATSSFGKTAMDVDGFYRCGRFIILSEIQSKTIPNILDWIFNLSPSGSGFFIDNNQKKTKVTVINVSEVFGDIHGRKDTRNRNVYIHYGYADCGINQINGSTPIIFTDMDWNVISDTPSETDRNGINGLNDVNVSYDSNTTGGFIFRKNSTYSQIAIPSPEFYDEKDRALLGDRDDNYYEHLQDNKESKYYTSFDNYINNLYRKSLNELIDKYTKVIKLNVNIENLSKRIQLNDDDFNEYMMEIASYAKYSLESCGFCGAEIIFGGERGFNIRDIKSQMDLSKLETGIYLRLLYGKIEELNNSTSDIGSDYTVMMKFSYSKVDVRIVDYLPIDNFVNNTSCISDELSTKLKVESSIISA